MALKSGSGFAGAELLGTFDNDAVDKRRDVGLLGCELRLHEVFGFQPSSDGVEGCVELGNKDVLLFSREVEVESASDDPVASPSSYSFSCVEVPH